MALTDENGMSTTMLVQPTNGGFATPYPVYQNSGSGGNNNGFGNDGWWIILLILVLFAGGWNGNNGNGGGFGGQPIIVNDSNGSSVQRGFDQASVMGGINGIQNSVYGLSTQLCNCCSDMQSSLCNGFAGVNQTVNSGFSQAEIANNARQMANMNQSFANQTAMNQGFNQISSQFADGCCENRLGIANLNSTILSENCADRYAAAQNTRDIIENANRNNQAVLDKLCQLELDGKNDRISDLERQLTMANLSASQTAQTAEIQRGQVAEVDALYNRLSQFPVPSMPVYGSQPIFTCPNNNCGCGCN